MFYLEVIKLQYFVLNVILVSDFFFKVIFVTCMISINIDFIVTFGSSMMKTWYWKHQIGSENSVCGVCYPLFPVLSLLTSTIPGLGLGLGLGLSYGGTISGILPKGWELNAGSKHLTNLGLVIRLRWMPNLRWWPTENKLLFEVSMSAFPNLFKIIASSLTAWLTSHYVIIKLCSVVSITLFPVPNCFTDVGHLDRIGRNGYFSLSFSFIVLNQLWWVSFP